MSSRSRRSLSSGARAQLSRLHTGKSGDTVLTGLVLMQGTALHWPGFNTRLDPSLGRQDDSLLHSPEQTPG